MKKEKVYRRLITAEFKSKYYPNGYFAGLEAANGSKSSRASYWIAFILIGILFNFGFIIGALIFDGTVTTPFLVCMAIGAVQLLLSSLFLRLGKKRQNKTREDWIAEAAELSGQAESVIREFDRQIMMSDSYFLTLTGKLDSVVDYILTEDFIGTGTKIGTKVFPIQELIGACLAYDMNNDLEVVFFTKEKYGTCNTIKNLSKDFFAMLKEKNPNIVIRDEKVLKTKEIEKWAKELKSSHVNE